MSFHEWDKSEIWELDVGMPGSDIITSEACGDFKSALFEPFSKPSEHRVALNVQRLDRAATNTVSASVVVGSLATVAVRMSHKRSNLFHHHSAYSK